MRVRKVISVVVSTYAGLSVLASAFEPRSGELFQAVRSGPGPLALYQLYVGFITFPVGLPLVVTGGACAIVDEVAFSVVDLLCLPYDLCQSRHGYYVRVSDDDGKPVEGAEFSAESHASSAVSGRIAERTDARGEVFVSRLARKHHINWIRISKEGYYDFSPFYFSGIGDTFAFSPSKATVDKDGRIVCDLKLRKIHRQVDMTISRINVPESVRDRKSCVLLFDCEKGEWMPPYGNGGVADLKLDIRLSREPEEGERRKWKEPYRMELSAVRPDDGFIVRDVYKNTAFVTDYVAPLDESYVQVLKEEPLVWGMKEERHYSFPHVKYCVMRLRTERADDGTIKTAHYGKLLFTVGSGCLVQCYFTKEPNERSLEVRRDR